LRSSDGHIEARLKEAKQKVTFALDSGSNRLAWGVVAITIVTIQEAEAGCEKKDELVV